MKSGAPRDLIAQSQDCNGDLVGALEEFHGFGRRVGGGHLKQMAHDEDNAVFLAREDYKRAFRSSDLFCKQIWVWIFRNLNP